MFTERKSFRSSRKTTSRNKDKELTGKKKKHFQTAKKETTVSKFQNDKIWRDFMAAVLHKPFLFAKLDILKGKIKEKIARF